MEFFDGDRVRYNYDPKVPNGWLHLHNARGTVRELDGDDGLVYVAFDFRPHLGLLPCEEIELIKVKEEAINAYV